MTEIKLDTQKHLFEETKEVTYKILKVKNLKPFLIRDLRIPILNEIKVSIEEQGYFDARVLAVVKVDNDYLVADGNHRLYVLNSMGIEKVPCVVYENMDPYQIAIQGNNTENTYAPMDLFDWLSIIQKLKGEGLTQKEIGEKIGWSRGKENQYEMLLNKIDTHILNLCKSFQKGRVSEKDTAVSFDFTEYWFRTSGLYDLNPFYQMDCLRNFVNNKCNWSKDKLLKEASKYLQWQEFVDLANSRLHNLNDLPVLVRLIHNNTYKSKEALLRKIDDFNSKAKNKLICGDATIELENLEDSSIDIVITDPPYGQDYVSQRSNYDDHISKEGIINDTPEIAFSILDQVCEILDKKTKVDAHFYIFCSWKTYPTFKKIIESFFEIKNVIIWDKGNHGAGDLEYNWGDCYEMIIYAIKGKRPLQARKQNLVSVPRIASSNLLHPTQKPVELIKTLIEVSAQYSDTICDPFMGSGSTIKAIIQSDLALNYIGIEIDRKIFEIAIANIRSESEA